MSDLFQEESPLAQMSFAKPVADAPRIEEKPFLGYINLRGKPGNTRFHAAVLKVLGCEPPLKANTILESGDYRIYWLGPDEWLVLTPGGQLDAVKAKLKQALEGVFASVVDVSSGLTLLNITGEKAASLLARDCPLDLHAASFKPGQCAQTRLAKAGMTIAPLREGNGFEVIIRRSFADYIALWMQDAALEFEHVDLRNRVES